MDEYCSFEIEFVNTIKKLLTQYHDIKNKMYDKNDNTMNKIDLHIELVKTTILINNYHIQTLLNLDYYKWVRYIDKVYAKCLEFETKVKNGVLNKLPLELIDEFNKTNNDLKEVLELMIIDL